MVNGADHTPIRRAGKPRSGPLSPNPSPPKPPIPARLESNFLSVNGTAQAITRQQTRSGTRALGIAETITSCPSVVAGIPARPFAGQRTAADSQTLCA